MLIYYIIDILANDSTSIKIIDIKTNKNFNNVSLKQLLFYIYLFFKSSNKKLTDYNSINLEFYNVRTLELKRYNLNQQTYTSFEKYLNTMANIMLKFTNKYNEIDFSDRENTIKNLNNKNFKFKDDINAAIGDIITINSKEFMIFDKNNCVFCQFKNICPMGKNEIGGVINVYK